MAEDIQFDERWWRHVGPKPDPIHEACERNPMWVYLRTEAQRSCAPGYHNANTEDLHTDAERKAFAEGYQHALYDAARAVYSIERNRQKAPLPPVEEAK